MGKPSNEQLTWLTEHAKSEHFENYSDWARSKGRAPSLELFEEYLNEWAIRLAKGPTTLPLSHFSEGQRAALRAALSKANRFGLYLPNDASLELEGKLLTRVNIRGSGSLILQNCAVQELSLGGRDGHATLELSNCWVGVFILSERSVNYLNARDGGVERIIAPLPNKNNPFDGTVSISNVSFSTRPENAQGYRNLRHHLLAIHNQEAASIFHSAEMRTLYQQQGKLDQVFNLIYRAFSDYGNSTARPLFWFFGSR